ncbi:FtsK-like DNA translocase [Gordonia phage GEazy]|nr:FtsK-like DNA translocase [Gordonia phage GEazy]QDF16768.1 FtsK-like DNA translocase [Gordonia phage HannahD]
MTTLMSFTVGTKDFRQALRSVSPHACRDDELPMINRVRCYVDTENVTVAATDRFTAAMGLVSVWDAGSATAGSIDLTLTDVAMILSVFTVGKENRDDAPEWQLRIELRAKRVQTTPGSDGSYESMVIRVTDVSGLVSGEVLEFPAMPAHSAFPDIPQLFANQLARPAGLLDTFAMDGDLLARLKVAARVYGNKPLVLSTPGAERSPILARCGESFLGLVMPSRFDEDARLRNKAWLDAWIRRLPMPDLQKVVDLDDVRQMTSHESGARFLRDAAEIVISTQFGSASMLQRRLSIGYKLADRLLDQLAKRGIVSHADEENSSQARAVLVKPGDLQKALDTLPAEEEDTPDE